MNYLRKQISATRLMLFGMLCLVVAVSLVVLPTAGHAQALSSFSETSGEHVFYFDFNAHVRQVYWSVGSGWTNQDLTSISSATTPANVEGGIASFTDLLGEHVFYIGTNSHVYQLYMAWGHWGQWVNQDLTFASLAMNLATSMLDSFSDRNGEHVFYTNGGNVYQLYASAGGWVNQDLTSSAPGVTLAGGAAAFNDSTGEHVAYMAAGGHIHQLSYPWGGSWVDQDLTAITRGPASAFAVSAFPDAWGEHVLYTSSTTNHIDQLYLPWGGSWVNQDLTTLTSGNLASQVTYLTSFADVMLEHVYYLDTNMHVNQLYTTSRWNDLDITALVKAPVVGNACAGGVLTSLSDGKGEHVFYLASDGDLHVLNWNTVSWIDQDLTANLVPSQRPFYVCFQ